MEIKKRSDLTKLLSDLYDVKAISENSIFGVNWWPAICLQCGYVLTSVLLKGRLQKNSEKQVLHYRENKKFPIRKLLRYLKTSILLLIKKRKFINRLKSGVLIGGFEHFKTNIDGKGVNIHADPFVDAFKSIGVSAEILLVDKRNNISDNSLEYLFTLLNQHFTAKVALQRFFLPEYNLQYKKTYDLAVAVKRYFEEKGIDCAEQVACKVQWRITNNEITYKAAIAFLKIVAPSQVINCVYENNTMLALQRAANYLSVPVTEYQHGSQDDDHYAYALWKNTDSYSVFFPSRFWVWSSKDGKRIVNNFYDTFYKPSVIIGGNVFLAQQKTNNIKEPLADKSVLIVLQGNWIPRYIEEVVEKRKDFKWYFRLHPRNPDDKGNLMALCERNPANVEMEEANKLPLYSLFKKVKFQITSFSSTALEGPAFKVASIIFGQDGYRQYESYIKDKQFYFIEDAAALENLLDNNIEVVNASDSVNMDSVLENLKDLYSKKS